MELPCLSYWNINSVMVETMLLCPPWVACRRCWTLPSIDTCVNGQWAHDSHKSQQLRSLLAPLALLLCGSRR
uniref:Uncharacterized protein n=1 Tax=Mandrillus leucophaeus TaxID=9568 RepID=A0A2K5XA84_MANLE